MFLDAKLYVEVVSELEVLQKRIVHLLISSACIDDTPFSKSHKSRDTNA